MPPPLTEWDVYRACVLTSAGWRYSELRSGWEHDKYGGPVSLESAWRMSRGSSMQLPAIAPTMPPDSEEG